MTQALTQDVRLALSDAARRLAVAGCESPRLDAELLLAEALGVDRAWLFANSRHAVGEPAVRRFEAQISRRAAREPVAYILGRRDFRHITLSVGPDVLIPRPDSELLVEPALDLPRGARVHDVGTGSGAVALAIKYERGDLDVSASDVSPAAVASARANARRLGLDVALTVADGLPPGDFDLVTANLPYVRADEWAALAPEIRDYEPRAALVGGDDGLDAIKALVAAAPAETRLALEHAPAQARAVRSMLADTVTHRDLAGRERVTVGVCSQ